ncbi:MAG: response regulator transcription factor [Chloroflexi bacterium]|nr:response regulator transcription factor [Chloroflexota bacterium]
MMTKPCVLIVDDERRYRELVELNLTLRGYRVVVAANGLEALNAVEREEPDLILLDVLLPDLDGTELCRRIREFSGIPIIMVSARAEEKHKVRAFKMGADDYVTKPFGADELLERVAAVLRRCDKAQNGRATFFRCGDLEIDFAQCRVTVEGKEVELTPGEFKLLQYLALNAGRVIVQEDLLRRVWGIGYESDVELLYSAIRRLRRKLEDGRNRRYVLTRRGIGYSLVSAPLGGLCA